MIPLLQQLLTSWVSTDMARPITLLAAAGVVFGLFLWLAGARFSRGLFTLAAVGAGAAVGLHLPRWYSIPLQNWAIAVGAALVIGLFAYALHRVLIKIGLSVLLCAWTAAAVWVLYGPGPNWSLPDRHGHSFWFEYIPKLWLDLPSALRVTGPIACGAALAVGAVIGTLLSRLATALFYSLLGVTMMAGLGTLALALTKAQLLEAVPKDNLTQLTLLGGLVIFGTLVQWVFSPRGKKSPPAPPPQEKQDEKPAESR